MLTQMLNLVHASCPRCIYLGAQMRSFRNIHKNSAISKILSGQVQNEKDAREQKQKRMYDYFRQSTNAIEQDRSDNRPEVKRPIVPPAPTTPLITPKKLPPPQAPIQEMRSFADQNSENVAQKGVAVPVQTVVSDGKDERMKKFICDVIEVADALSMASATIPQEKLHIPALLNVYEGLKAIEALFQQVLERHGIEQMWPLNCEFDPRSHEALKRKSVNGAKSNVIVEIARVGYTLNGRCIRPALVIIAD